MPQSIFTPETLTKRSWKHFAASYVLEIIGILVISQLWMMVPQVTERKKDLGPITWIAPQEEVHTPPPPPVHIQPPPQQVIKRLEPKIEQPKIEPPKVEVAKVEPPPIPTPEPPAPKPEPKPEPPKVETGKFDTPTPPAPKPSGNPNKPIETGLFSGSSAKPTIKAKVSEVQTGGFGDPNGVPVGKQTNDHPALTVAKVGSFDLPQGDGYGNGSGGSKGKRGVVASSGFGPGVAGPGTGDRGGVRGGSRTVSGAGFSDMASTSTEPTRKQAKADAPAPVTPVEILEKPKPAYTAEARQMKIEGEVLLKVVFRSSGEVEVLGVERGLGHGLDESAMSAAKHIRFKPAQRQGQAVDYNATVHIMFELAS
jgi:TonB family protein